MGGFLAKVPVELAEIILSHLSLADIRSLRVVDREASIKASGAGFKRYCTKKNVDLRAATLRTVADAIGPDSVASSLESLTLTGVLHVNNGLKKILRSKKIPANRDDPMGIRKDINVNNGRTEYSDPPQPGSQEDLEDAEAQLVALEQAIDLMNQERESGQDLQATIELFRSIKSHGRSGYLKSLKLDIVVYRDMHTRLKPEFGAPFRKIQATAMHTLSVALRAWKESGLVVERFDIFSDVKYCSVQHFELNQLQECFPANTLKDLKSLSVSISNRLLPWSPESSARCSLTDFTEIDHDDIDLLRQNDGGTRRTRRRSLANAAAPDVPVDEQVALLSHEGNSLGVTALLQHSITLEELDLHMYFVHNRTLKEEAEFVLRRQNRGEPVIRSIANLNQLPNLRNLTLRGFAANSEDLYKLLTNIPRLHSVDLRYIYLHQSISNGHRWETIFMHLLEGAPSLSNIYLDLLYDNGPPRGNRYVYCFATPGSVAETKRRSPPPVQYWQGHLPGAGGYNALHLHTREEVKQGFQWAFEVYYHHGSPQLFILREERRRLYGPG